MSGFWMADTLVRQKKSHIKKIFHSSFLFLIPPVFMLAKTTCFVHAGSETTPIINISNGKVINGVVRTSYFFVKPFPLIVFPNSPNEYFDSFSPFYICSISKYFCFYILTTTHLDHFSALHYHPSSRL